MYNKEVMIKAIDRAQNTMLENIGGPFGAAVVKDGQVVCVSSNSVLKDHDPTAHAEVNAIREACKVLGTHDLSGCELYATGYPCPMCLSAIIWANIKTVYYCNDVLQAEEIGFRDEFIYNYIKNNCEDSSILSMTHHPDLAGSMLYKKYQEAAKEMY